MSDIQSEFTNLWGTTKASDNQEKKFDVLPDGRYVCQMLDTKLDLTSQPHRITIAYAVGRPEQYHGRRVWQNFTLTDKGIPILKSEMSKLGLKHDDVKSLEDLSKMLNGQMGLSVDLSIKGRSYAKKDGTTGHAHNVYIQDKLAKTPVTPSFDHDEPISF